MLKRILWFLLVPVAAHAQTAALPVYDCIQHATQATVSGLKSTNYQLGVIRSCRVTIYLTGTTNIATTSPQSPYTANTDGSLPPTYAATGVGYDVVFSGGIPPNTYPQPVTLTDVQVGGGGGGGGNPAPPLNSIQYNNAGMFGGANADVEATNASSVTIGQVDRLNVSTWSCDASLCTFLGPNSLSTGDLVTPNATLINTCVGALSGNFGRINLVSATPSQVQIDLTSTTGCVDGSSGSGGELLSDYEGLTVNGGENGINLLSIGDEPDAGILICAADSLGPGNLVTGECSKNEAHDEEVRIAAANDIILYATNRIYVTTPYVNYSPEVFSSLPGCIPFDGGSIAVVSDSTTDTWGQVITGTGTPATPYVMAFCDGAQWTVMGTFGSGGGGSTSFAAITDGSNTTAAMTVGSGASLTPTSGGIIIASQLGSSTVAANIYSVGNTANSSFYPVFAGYGGVQTLYQNLSFSINPNTGLVTAGQLSTVNLSASGNIIFPAVAAPSTDVYCVQVDDTGQLSNTGAACGSGGSGAVNSVSNSDSSLTISPTTGAVVASLNLAHAQTWTALQTFGNDISIGGVTPSGATGTGNIVFATSPTFVTPALGTPASGVITNLTGTCTGCTANAVTSITGTQVGTAATLAQYDFYLSGGVSAAPAGLACSANKVLEGSATTPTCTATPQLGASGTLGSLTFGNASSGTVTLQPVTGALGTVTASLPANTGTIAELNLAQTFSAVQTISPSNGLVLSAMTGTSCIEEVSGVLTATGSACGSSSGSVTSVALALPASVFSISGSPVSTTGTLTGAFQSQAANTVFAGPTSGGSATPTFRTLASADIPSNAANTSGQAGSVANILTMNNSGSGAASGATYNGSAAQTISYNTIGAAPAIGCTTVSSLSPANNGCYQLSTSSSVAMPSASAFTIFTVQTESGATATFTSTTLSSDAGCSGFVSGGTLALTGNHSIVVKSDGTNVWASCI